MTTFDPGERLTAADLNALVARLDAIPPVGSMAMWPTDTPPTGWLICDGSAFSAVTYPELASVLGGTTLPDMRDRDVVGASDTKDLGTTGGADSVTLSAGQLPSHYHSIGGSTGYFSANHTHNISTLLKTNTDGGGGAASNGGDSVAQGKTGGRFNATQSGTTSGVSSNHTHTLPANTGSTGSGTSVPVQNPYMALNFIIRAA